MSRVVMGDHKDHKDVSSEVLLSSGWSSSSFVEFRLLKVLEEKLRLQAAKTPERNCDAWHNYYMTKLAKEISALRTDYEVGHVSQERIQQALEYYLSMSRLLLVFYHLNVTQILYRVEPDLRCQIDLDKEQYTHMLQELTHEYKEKCKRELPFEPKKPTFLSAENYINDNIVLRLVSLLATLSMRNNKFSKEESSAVSMIFESLSKTVHEFHAGQLSYVSGNKLVELHREFYGKFERRHSPFIQSILTVIQDIIFDLIKEKFEVLRNEIVSSDNIVKLKSLLIEYKDFELNNRPLFEKIRNTILQQEKYINLEKEYRKLNSSQVTGIHINHFKRWVDDLKEPGEGLQQQCLEYRARLDRVLNIVGKIEHSFKKYHDDFDFFVHSNRLENINLVESEIKRQRFDLVVQVEHIDLLHLREKIYSDFDGLIARIKEFKREKLEGYVKECTRARRIPEQTLRLSTLKEIVKKSILCTMSVEEKRILGSILWVHSLESLDLINSLKNYFQNLCAEIKSIEESKEINIVLLNKKIQEFEKFSLELAEKRDIVSFDCQEEIYELSDNNHEVLYILKTRAEDIVHRQKESFDQYCNTFREVKRRYDDELKPVDGRSHPKNAVEYIEFLSVNILGDLQKFKVMHEIGLPVSAFIDQVQTEIKKELDPLIQNLQRNQAICISNITKGKNVEEGLKNLTLIKSYLRKIALLTKEVDLIQSIEKILGENNQFILKRKQKSSDGLFSFFSRPQEEKIASVVVSSVLPSDKKIGLESQSVLLEDGGAVQPAASYMPSAPSAPSAPIALEAQVLLTPELRQLIWSSSQKKPALTEEMLVEQVLRRL